MANVLRDNTVIPSYLGVSRRGHAESTGHLDNLPIRTGEVKALVYPDDPNSVSGKFLEYTVEVQHRDSRGPGVSAIYYGCTTATLFGGSADRFEYTLRADDPNLGGQRGDDGIGIGSKVALLCINGETTRALIIGGVNDSPDTSQKADKSLGHHLLWEFNGIKAEVNSDGEFTLTFGGPTKADGTLADGVQQSDTGAQIQVKKNGDVALSHDDQSVTIDHQNQNVVVLADNEVDLTGKKNVNVTTQGTATISSAATKIGSQNASEALVLGTTWRGDETGKNNTMISQFNIVATALGGLATAMATAGTSLGAAGTSLVSSPPVAAAALGAASAALGAMTTSLSSLGTAFAQIAAAIAQFEARAQAQLSKKNSCD